MRSETAQHTLPVLDSDVFLTISDGRATSPPHRLRVTDKPYLGDVVAQASYPAYLDRVDEDVALAGVLVPAARDRADHARSRLGSADASVAGE